MSPAQSGRLEDQIYYYTKWHSPTIGHKYWESNFAISIKFQIKTNFMVQSSKSTDKKEFEQVVRTTKLGSSSACFHSDWFIFLW